MKQARLLNNIVGGSYVSDERIAGCAISQNLYAESVEEASNGFYYTTSLRSVEGERVVLKDFVEEDVYAQGCRGLFSASDESIFAAFGDGVYRFIKNVVSGEYESEKIYKSSFSNVGEVSFCETGGINSHVCWVNGTEIVAAYPLAPEKAIYSGFTPPLLFHTPLRQYKTADQVVNNSEEHIRPNQICSLNGSLIINDPETDTWYFTDAYILGGTTYNREVYELDANGNVVYEAGSTYKVKTKSVSLTDTDPSSAISYIWLDRYSKPNFMTAEYSADKVTGMIVCGDYLYVFGTRSIQIYNQTTSTDVQGFSTMVFSSLGRNVRDLGCSVISSIFSINGAVVFLGESVNGGRSVWTISGSTPSRISTNAIEREIEGAFVDDAYATGFSRNGHGFYAISVPSLNKTYVYDFATNQWHNRSTQDDNGDSCKWWVKYTASAAGDTIVAGSGVGIVAVLDKSKYDDYKGNPIVKMRQTPVIMSDYSPFIINDIQLMWNSGTTNDVTNDDGAVDPVVMLSVSADGGNTFGEEMWASGGRAGDYGHRTIWYGAGGLGTMFVLRFTISDRVNVVITGAKISHTALNSF